MPAIPAPRLIRRPRTGSRAACRSSPARCGAGVAVGAGVAAAAPASAWPRAFGRAARLVAAALRLACVLRVAAPAAGSPASARAVRSSVGSPDAAAAATADVAPACAKFDEQPNTGIDRVVRALVDDQRGAQVVPERVEPVDGGRPGRRRSPSRAGCRRCSGSDSSSLRRRRARPASRRPCELAQVVDDRARRDHRRRAAVGRLAERLERGDGRARERPELEDHPVDVGRHRAEVGEHRRHLVAERAEPHHRRRQLAQELRQPLDVGLEGVAALGGRLRDRAGVLDRAADVAALAGQRPRIVSESTASRSSTSFWLGEDLQDLVDLLERRVGAADDLLEVLAAAGDADARGRLG